MPPSLRVLEQRLSGRGTEDEETIQHRLFIAKEEIRKAYDYDYVVINDTVEKAVEDIKAILCAEKRKIERNKKTVSEVINNV